MAYDGEVTRFGVTPVPVDDWSSNSADSGVEIDEEGSGSWWESLSVGEIALIAMLSLLIFLLSMVIVGRLRKSNFDPLEHATPNWELQVEDWGGDNYAATMEPEINFEETLMPAATSIRETPPPSSISSTRVPDEDLESLAGDLLDNPASNGSDDPFDLDDLL